jgi:hypothetical protein
VDVTRLLTDHVDSFETLELLVAYGRAPADPQALALATRAFGAAPTEEQRAACIELAAAYERDRFEIVTQMSRIAFDRIRHVTTKAFADAFRIRKPGKDDPDA